MPIPLNQAQFAPGPKRVRDYSGFRVLVVDDNPVNRRVAGIMLKHAGCPAEFVSGGQEAVNTMAAAPDGFGVILMDVEMPGMSGIDATRLLRERHGPGPRIVGLTSHCGEEQISACLAAGMNAVLTKPLSQTRLLNSLCP